MKKLLSAFAIAASICALSSCTKDGGLFGGGSITGTITEEYMDGSNALYWGNGASFSLFEGSTNNEQYVISSGEASRKGKFKSEGGETKGSSVNATVAVSPYSASNSVSMSGEEATVKMKVPSTTTFTTAGVYDAGTCPLVAVTSKGSKNIPFVAPLGGVSVKLTGEVKISRVEVTAKGGEIINGDLTVTADKDGVKTISMTGGTSTTVVDCGDGIQLTQVAKDFVVFLPYGTYEQGFVVKVTSSDGNINAYDIDGPKKITKARILNISRQQFVIYTDLNAGSTETANCYVIGETGGYYFDATVKGNGSAGIHSTFKDQNPKLSPSGAKLVWEEVTGLVTGVTYADGKIYFACSGKEGNAVIAATDDAGNIIWSWHIWSTLPPTDIVCGDVTFLNKNVGAENEKDPGMYYQWGRKDPFSKKMDFDSGHGEGKYHPVAGGSNNPDQCTIEYSVAHPDTYIANCGRNNDWLLEAPQRYLWGMCFADESLKLKADLKTIYDPCPAGYSVASPAALASGGDRNGADGGLTVCGGKVFLPYASFIYNGGWGWWDGGATYATVWTCSTSWGNLDNGFRLQPDDFYGNYDRACGEPVRCVKR